MPTHTPGMSYFIRQQWPELCWQVVQITEDQARVMRERGERTYETSAQAYQIAARLNAQRKRKSQTLGKDLS